MLSSPKNYLASEPSRFRPIPTSAHHKKSLRISRWETWSIHSHRTPRWIVRKSTRMVTNIQTWMFSSWPMIQSHPPCNNLLSRRQKTGRLMLRPTSSPRLNKIIYQCKKKVLRANRGVIIKIRRTRRPIMMIMMRLSVWWQCRTAKISCQPQMIRSNLHLLAQWMNS